MTDLFGRKTAIPDFHFIFLKRLFLYFVVLSLVSTWKMQEKEVIYKSFFRKSLFGGCSELTVHAFSILTTEMSKTLHILCY
ncbi:MAG: hypothetical protein AYK19_08300 [Theionarchaea archaeon DG-70-1]|nr:MAG: hypothetical protein AYK19_08300 [Theionarchaea archaeon DG-70-1]